MNTRSDADRIVERYLDDLDRALAGLPASRRREICDEISVHISEARARLDGGDEAAVRALLERVGNPEEIAAEAGARAVSGPGGWADALVPWLVLLGGFFFLIGWLAGVGLLWSSATWRLRDKLLGTLVVPGGLALPVLLLGLPTAVGTCNASGRPGVPTVTHCTTSGLVIPPWVGIAVVVMLLAAPIAVAVHLERARRRP
ncbi:MAG: hypothetical protein M0Z42_02295 [Actinomycetota bacterium]|jgi:hypothetical protein|nr:hypothetical protein [Actinomycetota bacterium]